MFATNPNNFLAFLAPYGFWLGLVLVMWVGGMLALTDQHRTWKARTQLIVKIGYLVWSLVTVVTGVSLVFRRDIVFDPFSINALNTIIVFNVIVGALTVVAFIVMLVAAWNVISTMLRYEKDVADEQAREEQRRATSARIRAEHEAYKARKVGQQA